MRKKSIKFHYCFKVETDNKVLLKLDFIRPSRMKRNWIVMDNIKKKFNVYDLTKNLLRYKITLSYEGTTGE